MVSAPMVTAPLTQTRSAASLADDERGVRRLDVGFDGSLSRGSFGVRAPIGGQADRIAFTPVVGSVDLSPCALTRGGVEQLEQELALVRARCDDHIVQAFGLCAGVGTGGREQRVAVGVGSCGLCRPGDDYSCGRIAQDQNGDCGDPPPPARSPIRARSFSWLLTECRVGRLSVGLANPRRILTERFPPRGPRLDRVSACQGDKTLNRQHILTAWERQDMLTLWNRRKSSPRPS